MIEVAMQSETPLSAPTSFAPPYQLRGYRAGDDATWLELQQSTGIYPLLAPDLFQREFTAALDGRQFFVMCDAQAIATGTAWHGEPLRAKHWGRLHWIAVHPCYQRQGIASNLCRHLLNVLRDLGCSGVYLTTGSENRPAIALYRRLGFIPWVRTHEEALFWESLGMGDDIV
jgi:ribosomal protein S18 acetylase RimI-like enzyme